MEPGGALGVRADPPLLVRPRRRGLPHRRRARDLQGPRAARRPGDPGPRHAAAVLDVQAGDARDPARVARARDDVRPAAAPPRRGVLARSRAVGRLLRRERRPARPRVRVHAHARGSRRRRDARRRRRDRGRAPGPCVAVLGRLEPRHRPPRDALGRRRRGSCSLRAPDPARPPRHAVSVLRRRARARGRCRAGRARSRLRDTVARSWQDADAVERRRRLARAVASARRHEPKRRGPACATGLDASTSRAI